MQKNFYTSFVRDTANEKSKHLVESFIGSKKSGLYIERKSSKATAIQAKISPTYFICNAQISYMMIAKKGEIFFQADNLFNKTYSDLLGATMPGRWLSGGIEINL